MAVTSSITSCKMSLGGPGMVEVSVTVTDGTNSIVIPAFYESTMTAQQIIADLQSRKALLASAFQAAATLRPLLVGQVI